MREVLESKLRNRLVLNMVNSYMNKVLGRRRREGSGGREGECCGTGKSLSLLEDMQNMGSPVKGSPPLELKRRECRYEPLPHASRNYNPLDRQGNDRYLFELWADYQFWSMH